MLHDASCFPPGCHDAGERTHATWQHEQRDKDYGHLPSCWSVDGRLAVCCHAHAYPGWRVVVLSVQGVELACFRTVPEWEGLPTHGSSRCRHLSWSADSRILAASMQASAKNDDVGLHFFTWAMHLDGPCSNLLHAQLACVGLHWAPSAVGHGSLLLRVATRDWSTHEGIFWSHVHEVQVLSVEAQTLTVAISHAVPMHFCGFVSAALHVDSVVGRRLRLLQLDGRLWFVTVRHLDLGLTVDRLCFAPNGQHLAIVGRAADQAAMLQIVHVRSARVVSSCMLAETAPHYVTSDLAWVANGLSLTCQLSNWSHTDIFEFM